MRIFIIIFLSLVFTLLGMVGGILICASTERGTHLLLQSFEKIIPGKLMFSSVHGKLISKLTLRNITYISENINVSINTFNLSWSPIAILHKKIKINTINANKIIIHIYPSQHNNHSPQPSYLSWLKRVELSQLNLQQIDIYQQKKLVFHLSQVKLQKKPDGQLLNIEGGLGNARINVFGTVKKIADINWQINIPAIDNLYPMFKGKLFGTGKIHGKEIEGTLQLKNIYATAQPDYVLSSAQLTTKIDLDKLVAEGSLNKGKILFKKLGSTLNVTELHVKVLPSHIFLFNGNFSSEAGRLALDGKFAPTQKGYPLELNLNGKNIRVVNLPEYRINLSPQLKVLYSTERLDLTGMIQVPWARIKPKDLSTVVTLPREVVFVDKSVTADNKLNNFFAHLDIQLGKDVLVHYQNLHANLGGNITITQAPLTPTTAIGELYTIKGRYRAYDRLLHIKSGRLIYAGNALTNPGLDIRAIKEIQTKSFTDGQTTFSGVDAKIKHAYTGSKNIMVGVWVKGTLEKPQISLFSDPPGLPQTDILSYLIFGYPQSQINETSSLSLLTALASNNHKEGKINQLIAKTEKLKKKLGITEFGVNSTEIYDPSSKKTENQTTFTVGKKLGDKVLLKYSVGIFSPIQILNLTLQLTKRLAIQSETSSMETGADIVYEFEKD